MREKMRPELTAKCLELIYAQSANANLASLAGGALLGAMFWDDASRVVILAWSVAYLVMIWIRYALGRRYLGAPPDAAGSRRWLQLFRLAVGLSGALWGVYALYLAQHSNPLQLAVVILTLGALLSGAAIAYAVIISAFLAFAVPAMLPLGVFLLWRQRPDEVFLGVLLLIWMIFMTRSASRFRDFAILSLGYQFENMQLVGELRRLSRTDALTGVANRRGFDEALDAAWARATAAGGAVAVILCDVDHFKAYNDTFGHPAGDECLRRIAAVLAEAGAAHAGQCARVGGEEFALLLDDGEPARAALALAEAMRGAVEALAIAHVPVTGRAFVTASFGVGHVQVVPGATAGMLLAATDRALYAAKDRGRNCVVLGAAGDTAATAGVLAQASRAG
ncbi:MAG: GGDEF domain-containing protein [Arenimonas sp.]